MLTPAQEQEFLELGFLRLPGAIPTEEAGAMHAFIWSALENLHGMVRGDPATWNVAAPWIGLKDFKRDTVFEAVGSPTVCGAIDDLLGPDSWKKPGTWGGFLVTCPDTEPDRWYVPTGYWHVDFHFSHEPEPLFGLRVFALLSDLGPRGGGPFLVRSSHRLVQRFVGGLTPEEVRMPFPKIRDRFMASHTWFERLTRGDSEEVERVSYFLEREHTVEGVPLRIQQLCGQAGDVVMIHPWLVHGKSPHSAPQPRFMLAKDIFRIPQTEPEPTTSSVPAENFQ